MRDTVLTLNQSIANKINSKEDFTHCFGTSSNRFVVAYRAVWEGKNPGYGNGMRVRISDAIALGKDILHCDSIGGWLDKETGVYYVDLNRHYDNFGVARAAAIHHDQVAIYDLVDKVEIRV